MKRTILAVLLVIGLLGCREESPPQFGGVDFASWLAAMREKVIPPCTLVDCATGKPLPQPEPPTETPVVPLPAGVWLLGAGLAGLLLVGRRR
jgi:hypothetical protein